MAQWYLIRDGKEQGPFSVEQIKGMATAKGIGPDDLVRRENMAAPIKAGKVRGLFEEKQPESGASSSEDKPTPSKRKFPLGTLLIIGASLVGVSLLLCCGGCGVLYLIGDRAEKQVRQKLADADKLWDAGDKAGAAQKYRDIMDEPFLHKDERPRVWGRVIDHEYESGNDAEGKRLIEAADKKDIVPSVTHADAKKSLADLQAEKDRIAAKKSQQESSEASSDKEIELVQLMVKTATTAASNDGAVGGNTDPDQFTKLMRSAAKELGADKHDDTRHLLEIEPTSRKEYTTPQGIPGLAVHYGWQASASFSKNRNTGRWQLILTRFGDEEWNALTGIKKK